MSTQTEFIIKLLTIFYIMPLWISLVYFTVIKIEDRARTHNKFYSKVKYRTYVKLSFVPLLNIAYTLIAVIKCFD